jgi:hypothetical protein
MKTSNKLLLSALILFVISVTIYNYALKAEYLLGNYKKPYRDYKSINIKDFNEIEVNSVDLMLVTIEQGDFAIHQQKDGDSVKFSRLGNKLVMNINLDEKPDPKNHFRRWKNRIIISCPKLVSLTESAGQILIKGKLPKDISYSYNVDSSDDWGITLRKFNMDSLSVNMWAGSLDFVQNNIKHLGLKAKSTSIVNINKGNKIEQANLQMNDFSELKLGKLIIPQLTYYVADSAKISLNGATLKSFIKKQP